MTARAASGKLHPITLTNQKIPMDNNSHSTPADQASTPDHVDQRLITFPAFENGKDPHASNRTTDGPEKKEKEKKEQKPAIDWDDLLLELASWMEGERLYIGCDQNIRQQVTKKVTGLSPDVLHTEMLLHIRKSHTVTSNTLKEAILCFITAQSKARRFQMHASLTATAHEVEGSTNLEKWVRAVTGACQETDLAVMRHYIWSVKRSMLDLDMCHHIMPIIYSPLQGIGKSQAVAKLMAPLQELCLNDLKAEILTDDRFRKSLSIYHAGIWDELGGMQKADAEALKQTITSTEVSYRPMYTNGCSTILNRMRLIGTSNRSVDDISRDATGNRRFYEIAAQDRMDWPTINSLDYAAIWASVDARADSPIHPFIQQIQAIQAEQRSPDAIEAWLEADGMAALFGEGAPPVGSFVGAQVPTSKRQGLPLHVVKARFVDYRKDICLEGDYVQVPSDPLFSSRLKQLGWTVSRPANGGGRTRQRVYTPPTKSVLQKDS